MATSSSSSSPQPLLWERMMDNESSRHDAFSSSVGGGGTSIFSTSTSSSPSRSCLTLPLPLRRGGGGGGGKNATTPTTASHSKKRGSKNSKLGHQRKPSEGSGMPLNSDVYDPYDMSWEEFFPYDTGNNITASAPTRATPNNKNTTATTAATSTPSGRMSPSTSNNSRSLSMTSKGGGGGGFGNNNNNHNNATTTMAADSSSSRDASSSLSWNFSSTSIRSSPGAVSSSIGRGGGGTAAADNNAPPSTTSSSSSSSSHYSAASSSPHTTTGAAADQQQQHNNNPKTINFEHLLTPPTPQDRASVPKRRQAYEQEQKKILKGKQRRGLYDGEIEPEGIRGQEADVIAISTTSATTTTASNTRTSFVAATTTVATVSSASSASLPAIRTFSNENGPNRSSSSTLLLPAIQENDQSPGRGGGGFIMKLAPTSPSSNSTDSNGSATANAYPAVEQPETNQSNNNNISGSSGSSKSSTSISSPEMYRQFVATKEKQEQQRRQELGVPSPSLSSPAAAAVAAAALPMQFHTSTGQAVRGYDAHEDNDVDNNDDNDNDDESDSTQSDDELRQMQADLIPTTMTVPQGQQQQQHRLLSSPPVHERFGKNHHHHHQHENGNTRTISTSRKIVEEEEERPSPAAAAAAATAARAVAAQQQQQQPLQMMSLSSSSSSPRFWSSNRPNNDNNNHSRDEEMSHSNVNNIVEGATAVASRATKDDDEDKKEDASYVSSIDALNVLAMEYVNRNEFGDAIATFMQVLKRQQEHYGDISPAVASAWHNLGTVYAKRVAALQRQLEEQQQQRSIPNTIGTAPTPVVQLELEQRTARQAALEAFQAAARTARDSLSTTHPNVAVSLVRIGFLLLQSRQYQNAVITFEEALRIRLHAYGPKHALVANLYNNLGVCHMHLGNFKQGRQSLLEGLVIQRQLVREFYNNKSCGKQKNDRLSSADNGGLRVHWLELADTLFNLGGLCLEWIRKQGPDLRRVEEAESSFAEALQIRTRVLGPDDPSVIQLREMLLMAKSIPRPHPRSLSPQPPYYSHRTTPSTHRNILSAKTGANNSTYGYKPATTTRKGTGIMMSGSRNNQSLLTADDTADFSAPDVSPSSLNHSLDQLEMSSIMNSDANPQSEDAPWNDHHLVERTPRSVLGTGAAAGLLEKGTSKDVLLPPVVEVRVSKEEEEELFANTDQPNRSISSETRIYVAPHLVPDSPSKRRQKDDSQIVVMGDSFEETLDLDSSNEIMDGTRSQPPKSFPYDAEESCLINDIGVDSEHGRVHYPLAWTKLDGSLAATACRDIVVTRPFRTGGGLGGEITAKATDVCYSTGNDSRDDVMARARALLDAHGQSLKRSSPADSDADSGEEGEDLLDARNVAFDEDYLMEDGLAPLGGSWSQRQVWEKQRPITELLEDPMNHVPDIHKEASKQLLANNFDSLSLFRIILLCQRRRNGPVHADVAAALHNVGICQLRASKHDEALQAFEESARIRKGSLGRDHPQVAVSLVKVGITLLLLHRFEDALWSFREALSVRKHALGPLHPATARIYNNIGCVHVEFNEFREARRAFEAALDIQRNAICHDPDSGPLLFAAATTLCNLGYLYRYRDLHEKAALLLKEAAEMQETVLGQSHATVLSTLDNLADSCASCGQTPEALRFYNIILKRFRVGGRTESQKVLHAEAVLLYKMSRVHRQRNDHESQLDSLKFALRSIRAYSDTASMNGIKPDTLERRILYDIRACREQMEKDELNWV